MTLWHRIEQMPAACRAAAVDAAVIEPWSTPAESEVVRANLAVRIAVAQIDPDAAAMLVRP